ncbi:aquaporin-10 [Trichonephila clavipes]|nr:aquaporin-10 [Trichonephila clavipes]
MATIASSLQCPPAYCLITSAECQTAELLEAFNSSVTCLSSSVAGNFGTFSIVWRLGHSRLNRFVEWAQNEIAVVPDFHKRILFSDEAHFWLNGYVNKQNCRIWSEANPQVYVETPLHPEKLTVWCALWAGGIIGPYFKNDEGHNVTVNGDRYRAMITNFFIPELNNHDVQELWFQQDGATCHTARATIDLLKDTFGDRLISRFGPVNWPPRSCDLTPLDYFLWGYVKSLVYADKPQTLDHLEDNIRRVIADIRPQMLEKVIENWTSRLDYIRANRGSPMPEIIFKIQVKTSYLRLFQARVIPENAKSGHINPAVTVAFATLGKFPWKKVGHYLLAQHLGAFVASAVLFVTYKDALDYIDPNRTITGETATAYIWATYPKPYVSILSCLLDQVVGTGLLMFTALAIIDTKNLNMPKWTHPIFLGFMISALAMCFGANCMAPLNPARDFATRCFTAVAGYGSEVFSYRNYWWVGLFGPHIGAIVGGWLYYLGIELHWPETRDDEKIGEHHELTMALNSANGLEWHEGNLPDAGLLGTSSGRDETIPY